MAEESLTSPRPPETDGVSGRTFAKVRGRFSRSLANRKATRGKRAGRWRAVVWPHSHIDDGSMGGGGPIPHDDYLESPDPYSDEWDDLYYSKNGYGFSQERQGLFHYCVFAHQDEDDPWGKGGYGGQYTEDTTYTDMLVVFDVLMGLLGYNKIEDQAKVFMHELGHNLGRGHSKKKNTVMYTMATEAEAIDYSSEEWKWLSQHNLGGGLP